MEFEDFPEELSLKFRAHVLFVYAQSTLAFAADLAKEGADNLDDDTLNAFDDLVENCERIWFEAAKLKKMARS